MPELTMDFIQRAAELFRTKTGMDRERFDRLDAEMRARAFTVSYVESVDRINSIQNLLDKAISEGTTLSKFRKAIVSFIDTHPWHLETVFRTNIQSAYGAANWENAQELRSLRPYGRYSAVMDGRTRPSHAKLHGLVYPLDHPFWKTYFPPWEFNCRCGVETLTQWEVEKKGLVPETTIPAGVSPPKDFVSPATAGLTIKPQELLIKRIVKMSPRSAATALETLSDGVEKALGGEAVVNMGGASPEFESLIKKTYNTIPEEIRELVESKGNKVKIGDFVTTIKPEFSGITLPGWSAGSTWDNVDGFYDYIGKTIGVSEKYKWGKNNEVDFGFRPVGALKHEVGHALDYCADGVIFSSRADFTAAYNKDRKEMERWRGKENKKHDAIINYMLHESVGPKEAFAEVTAAILGDTTGSMRPSQIKIMMRNTTKHINTIIGGLKK